MEFWMHWQGWYTARIDRRDNLMYCMHVGTSSNGVVTRMSLLMQADGDCTQCKMVRRGRSEDWIRGWLGADSTQRNDVDALLRLWYNSDSLSIISDNAETIPISEEVVLWRRKVMMVSNPSCVSRDGAVHSTDSLVFYLIGDPSIRVVPLGHPMIPSIAAFPTKRDPENKRHTNATTAHEHLRSTST